MEDKPLPPAQPISPEGASESLERADANASVASYSIGQKNYPIETLEVHSEGSGGAAAGVVTGGVTSGRLPMPLSRRKAALVSLMITLFVVIATGISLAYVVRKNTASKSVVERSVPTQSVSVSGELDSSTPVELQGQGDSLLVNGDIIARGVLKVSSNSFVHIIRTQPLTTNQTLTLPNVSGTVCVDVNNCNYATQQELAAQAAQLALAQQQLTQLVIPPAGVQSLNNQTGAVNIQGSTNRINVAAANGLITLTTPQDLDANANVQFNSLTVNASGSVVSNLISHTGNGSDLTLDAFNDDITLISGGRNFVFPAGGSGTQTICTTQGNCGGGGSTPVILAPGSAQTDASTDVAIFINDTGGGNLIQLQSSGIDRLTVTTGGDTTVGGNLTVSGLGSGVVRSTGGLLSIGSVNVATEVTGTLAVSNGGTGAASLTADGVLVGNGTSPVSSIAAGAAGLCFISNAGAPSWQTCPGSGGAPVNAGYLVTSLDGTLTGERAILAGSNMTFADAGANGSFTIATVTNPQFTSSVMTPLLVNAGLTLNASGANAILLQTNSSTRVTVGSTGDVTMTNNLIVQGTGTSTFAGSLAVDTSTLFVDAANNRVGINDATPSHSLDVTGNTNIVGHAGIGDNSSPSAVAALSVGETYTGADVCSAFGCHGALISVTANNVTSGGLAGVFSGVGTAATGFTLQQSAAIVAGSASAGAGSTITDNYGILVQNQTAGTNDYGILIQGADTYALWVDNGISRFDGNLEFEGATDDAFEFTVSVADPTADRAYTIPNSSSTTDQFCLVNLGNCAGSGGGVTGSGTNNRVAKFTSTGSTIGDSTLTDDGTNISATGDFTLQGGDLTLGTTTGAGSIIINDGNGGQTVTLNVANVAANRIYTFPDAGGNADVCLSSGNCLGGGSGGAPANAEYLVSSLSSSLSNERALTSGSNVTFTDGGANGNFTIATVQNPTFTTSVTTPLLTSTGALSITPGGALSVGSTSQTSLLQGSTVSVTSTAGNDITLTSGNQIVLNASSSIELQDNTNITGGLVASGTGTFQGASVTIGGAAQPGVLIINDGSSNTGTLQTAALGQNTVYTLPDPGGTSADICLSTGNCVGSGGGAPNAAEYLVVSLNGTLTNDRALTAGSNISFTDGGANGNFTVATVANPSFATSVTTPSLQSASTLGISNTSGDITMTSADQIILDAATTIDLMDDTNISGTLGIGTAATSSLLTIVSDPGEEEITFTGDDEVNIVSEGGNIYLTYDATQASGSSEFGIYTKLGVTPEAVFLLSNGGNASVRGTVTSGNSSLAGSFIMHDGSSNTATLQTILTGLGQNTTYNLIDPGVSSIDICLSSGNCAGSGTSVTTAGGTTNRIAMFSGTQAVANSWLLQNGSTLELDNTRNLTLVGGELAVGTTTGYPLLRPSTTAANPGYTFAGENDTGMFLAGTDMLGISTGGIQRIHVDASGFVGIGDTSVDARLDVDLGGAATTATEMGLEVRVDQSGNLGAVTDNTYGQLIYARQTGGGGNNTTQNIYGLDITAIGDSTEISTVTGLNINVSGGDTNYAAILQGGSVIIGTTPSGQSASTFGDPSGTAGKPMLDVFGAIRTSQGIAFNSDCSQPPTGSCGRTEYFTGADVASHIYSTNQSGAAVPFTTSGNLVLQAKGGSSARGIYFVTGTTSGTPTVAARLWIENSGDTRIAGHLIPDFTSNNRDLGSTAQQFRDLYVGANSGTTGIQFGSAQQASLTYQSTPSRLEIKGASAQGSLFIEDRLYFGMLSQTITDDGTDDTLQPVATYYQIDVDETANAAVPILAIDDSSTYAREGQLLIITNTENDGSNGSFTINTVTNTVYVPGGSVTLDTRDSITLIYDDTHDYWVTLAFSNN